MNEYTVKVYDDGDKLWYKNGKLHREDGPAVERNGTKEWWVNGKLHREDGPALELNSTKEWWVNGKRHREDGPAVEWANGTKKWWVNGKQYIEKEFNERNSFKEYTIKELELLLDHRIKIVNNH